MQSKLNNFKSRKQTVKPNLVNGILTKFLSVNINFMDDIWTDISVN